MTPAERLQGMLHAAQCQLEANLNAIASFLEAGLMTRAQADADIANAHETYDWNVGMAHIEFQVDTGHCVEPPATRLRKVGLTGFEGDAGSATSA